MTKPRLVYFDFAGSRGEECRIALHVAGVDFEDVRVKREEWPALKPQTPFGAMPVFEIPGHKPLAQSNAILNLIGRRHGLHPGDDFERAQAEALMESAEDLRHKVSPTLRITDEAQKKTAREELARNEIPTWAGQVERQLGDGPFVAGDQIGVADIKLYMLVRWFAAGTVDHVPATVFDAFPRLKRLYEAVAAHPRVREWVERQGR